MDKYDIASGFLMDAGYSLQDKKLALKAKRKYLFPSPLKLKTIHKCSLPL